jgi:hypothetical protein
MEVELAIVAPDSMPACRFVQDAAQRGLIFPKKIAAQTRLALVIPEGGGLQLLWHFRMSNDAHGAWPECP